MKSPPPQVKKFGAGANKRSAVEDARETLSQMVLAHVPVVAFDFKMKAVYMALMVRRVIEAEGNEKNVDDR